MSSFSLVISFISIQHVVNIITKMPAMVCLLWSFMYSKLGELLLVTVHYELTRTESNTSHSLLLGYLRPPEMKRETLRIFFQVTLILLFRSQITLSNCLHILHGIKKKTLSWWNGCPSFVIEGEKLPCWRCRATIPLIWVTLC